MRGVNENRVSIFLCLRRGTRVSPSFSGRGYGRAGYWSLHVSSTPVDYQSPPGWGWYLLALRWFTASYWFWRISSFHCAPGIFCGIDCEFSSSVTRFRRKTTPGMTRCRNVRVENILPLGFRLIRWLRLIIPVARTLVHFVFLSGRRWKLSNECLVPRDQLKDAVAHNIARTISYWKT